jgi:hypothetical protein
MLMFWNTLFHLHRLVPTRLWRRNRQSVPKRRHIKFRCRGITQKKAYNSLPSSLTSSCHLFLGLPLSLVVSKFIYNNFYRCTVHSEIYIVHSPTNALFIELRKV